MIQLSENEFERLVLRVVEIVKGYLPQREIEQQEWLPPAEAMKLLNLKSQVSLYQLRMNGEITYTQPKRKVILYSRESIQAYLAKHQKMSFK